MSQRGKDILLTSTSHSNSDFCGRDGIEDSMFEAKAKASGINSVQHIFSVDNDILLLSFLLHAIILELCSHLQDINRRW